MEHGAGRNGELIAAKITLVLVALPEPRNGSLFATLTAHAFGPAKHFQQFAASIFTLELFDEFD